MSKYKCSIGVQTERRYHVAPVTFHVGLLQANSVFFEGVIVFVLKNPTLLARVRSEHIC